MKLSRMKPPGFLRRWSIGPETVHALGTLVKVVLALTALAPITSVKNP